MRSSPILRALVPLVALLATGCAAGRDRGPAVRAEGEVRRAALARVVVENRTGERLSVAFLAGAGPGGEVGVGAVAGNSTASMAPVLAGEPVVLIARTAAGAEYRLAARSFDIDAEWTWVIPEDAFGAEPGRGEGQGVGAGS